MKPSLQFLLCAALSISAFSCKKIDGDGPSVTQTRSHSGFTAIASGIDAKVEYSQAPTYKVEIHAQQNILDRIRSEMRGGELSFYYQGAYNFGPHDPITIYISAPDVTGFTINGSGELYGGTVSALGKSIRLTVNGSGALNFSDLSAREITADVFGSGKMQVAGAVESLSCDISGSGEIDFGNLRAARASTNISGSGKMHVQATQSLEINISGSGKVYYRGNPQLQTNISGSGSAQAY